MADDLQALLDKIEHEGIQKGEETANGIIAKAQAEAAAIIAKAQTEAAQLKRTAEAENATLKEKSELALRQAAREIQLELRGQLEKRVAAAVSALLKAVMTPQQVAPVIAHLCESYMKDAGNNSAIDVLLPEKDLAVLKEAVEASLAAELKKNISFAPNRFLASGFKLNFKDGNVIYDFSDEALCEAIAAHLSPALTEILTKDAN